ncbi:ATP-binding protein [Nocardioides sp. S-58]|uniref:ATP-binding protein n=1 Tax=Nocardioides renjunii TaxID=3095075 RepID=A0ABU5KBE5_9ACTN|nr:ATP-binding protein [Nocardioides sp. S-58]MDZ5662266.1 ATP-binding protein [Nocardioides sp. S-58]
MSGAARVTLTLSPEPVAASRARHAVREALTESGAEHLLDAAQLVVSELVTNAVVHAGTPVHVRVTAETDAVRVEVEDASPHLPAERSRTVTAGTGRGLKLVTEQADRWDVVATGEGKIVWFEIGVLSVPFAGHRRPATPPPRVTPVVLRHVPLLMHWAWQEHAAALLREYLLFRLDKDDAAIDDHAAASTALNVLDAQLPRPELPEDPDALLATVVEPQATCDEVVVLVPTVSVHHFVVLDNLLERAIAAAQDGRLLSAPIQPEIRQMRAWLCAQVGKQAAHGPPTPWRPAANPGVDIGDVLDRRPAYARLLAPDSLALVTSDAHVILAVSPRLVSFLRYRESSELLGRRVLAVVPPRFHQAHVAGATLHATNGRDVLLHQWVSVPVVRADGGESLVELLVEPQHVGDERVFVAEFREL